MIFSILLTIICGLIGFYGFDAFYHEEYLFGIVSHLLGVLIGLVIIKFRMQNQRGITLPVALILFVPVLGALGVSVLALDLKNKGRRGILEEYAIHINPEEYRELFTRDYNEFKPDPTKLYSLSDVLQSNLSVVQKRVAIEALAQMDSPRTIAILREALQMGSVEVRFFSSSVLSKMEMRLEQKLLELKSEDRGNNQVSVISELAQVYFDFVFFSIVDGTRKEEYLNLALGYTLDALSLELNNSMLAIAGRILLMKEQYKEATKIFNLYIREYPEDVRGWLWRAEAYLHTNDYNMVSYNAKMALEIGGIPSSLVEAAEFWAKGVTYERAV